jgi:predicted Zn-dependent protease
MDRIPEAAQLRVEGTLREAIELDEKNQSDQAIRMLTQLVGEFPEAGTTHSYLGWMLSKAGKHREAIQHGRLAVQFEPASERVSLLFFRVLWSAEEFQQAFDEMKRFSAHGHSEEYVRMMAEWQGMG